MVLAGVNYLDMLLKSRLDGQKRRSQLQIWEALRYNSSACMLLPSAVTAATIASVDS